MKLRSIKVSNILSFGLNKDFSKISPICFEAEQNKGGVSVLIGPNGAGKSNFFQILNETLQKALVNPFTFNEGNVVNELLGKSPQEANVKNTIVHRDANLDLNLPRHRTTEGAESAVRLELDLTESDYKNLEFIVANLSQITTYLDKYSNHGNAFKKPSSPLNLRTIQTIEIHFSASSNPKRFSEIAIPGGQSAEKEFIKNYFHCFNLLQRVVQLQNRLNQDDPSSCWPMLQDSFAVMSAYRDIADIPTEFSISDIRSDSHRPIEEKIKGTDLSKYSDTGTTIFQYVLSKLGQQYLTFKDQGGQKFADDTLKASPMMSRIDRALRETLGISFGIRFVTDQKCVLEFGKNSQKLQLNELSVGERSIIQIILTAVGHDLKSGLLLLDEPELHLHPQIQSNVLNLISDLAAEYDLQIILATHSPSFITERTISNVYRFYLDGDVTKIIRPALTPNQKVLLRVLELSNATKIFFARKVLLVEGESDEYFMRFFLKKEYPQEAQGIEVLNIQGKGNRQDWIQFLSGMGLPSAFVGDFDNLVNEGIFTDTELVSIWAQACPDIIKELANKGSNDGKALLVALPELIADPSQENLNKLKELQQYLLRRHIGYRHVSNYLEANDKTKWAAIDKKIQDCTQLNLFYLKKGELEDYLGLQKKGLDSVREFCNSQYSQWAGDQAFTEFRTELLDILKQI